MLCHMPTPDPPELLILVLLLPLLLFDVVLPTLPQDALDILVAVEDTAPPTLSICPLGSVSFGDGVLELTILLQ